MPARRGPRRRRDAHAGPGTADESGAAIQREVFRRLGSTPESQRFALAVRELVKKHRVPISNDLPRQRPAFKNAAARRRALERFERKVFSLARDIIHIDEDRALGSAFEEVFDSSVDGKPPGFPDTGLILEKGDLNEQFLAILALGYAARHVRRTWRAHKKGPPRRSDRDRFIRALATAYERATGIKPAGRKRDTFSDIAAEALRFCGFRVGDVRDAVASALSAEEPRGWHITFTVEPRLRQAPELTSSRGNK